MAGTMLAARDTKLILTQLRAHGLVGISLNTKQSARCVLTEALHSSRGRHSHCSGWKRTLLSGGQCADGRRWWPWPSGMRTWGGARGEG